MSSIEPAPGPEEAGEQAAVSAGREHALQSLLELGREMTVALGVHETCDLVLFNLMGQLRTPRSAIWLIPEDGDTAPVMVRSHGFHRPLLDAVGSACGRQVCARFRRQPDPVLSWALQEELGAVELGLVRHASIAILAPLYAREELLGWLALGERVDGSAYRPEDLQVLGAALGIVAVSLQNARLYNRSCESNRLLRSANEHLNELDRLKTQFLSNVNHELRTPLAVVMGSLECVIGMDVDVRVQGLLEASLEQSKKLYGLIENLLTFSEAVNARLPVNVVPEDAGRALMACHEERQPGVAAGLRELTCRIAPGLPRARFDRVRLRQIVNELIDNAVKFTPRGTRITLSAEVASEDGREWVRFEVLDDGPGIPPERMEQIFHSFEQVDGSATRRVGGLGMGLAFAHRLASCMGARLTATSEIDKGTSFRLLLPLAPD